VVEKPQQRTRTGKCDSQYRADAQVNPKKITRQRICQFFALHDQFRETSQPETAEQEAERSNHGHDSEVGRKKQACQGTTDAICRTKLPAEPAIAAPAPPHRGAAKVFAVTIGWKVAVGLKGFQSLYAFNDAGSPAARRLQPAVRLTESRAVVLGRRDEAGAEPFF